MLACMHALLICYDGSLQRACRDSVTMYMQVRKAAQADELRKRAAEVSHLKFGRPIDLEVGRHRPPGVRHACALLPPLPGSGARCCCPANSSPAWCKARHAAAGAGPPGRCTRHRRGRSQCPRGAAGEHCNSGCGSHLRAESTQQRAEGAQGFRHAAAGPAGRAARSAAGRGWPGRPSWGGAASGPALAAAASPGPGSSAGTSARQGACRGGAPARALRSRRGAGTLTCPASSGLLTHAAP